MTFQSSLFTERRKRLIDQLPDRSVALFFSGKAPYMSADHPYGPFHVNRNFYYLTGVSQENSALLLAKLDGGTKCLLFTERVDPVEEKWTGKRLTEEQAIEISGVESAIDMATLENRLGSLLSDGLYESLYLDLEVNHWAQTETQAHRFATVFQTKYPTIGLKNAYALVVQMRTLKDDSEVAAMKEAIQITKTGLHNMLTNAKPGMREFQLEAFFDFSLRFAGVPEHAFPPIIAAGERATILHYVDNDGVAEDGDLVLCDLGASHLGYSADISRTFPVSGKFSARQRQLYDIVLKAMHEAFAIIRPGVTRQALRDVVKATYASELKSIGLIEHADEVDTYFYHGVSHRLGLDTHDVGPIDLPFEEGDVITVEPGLYIAEEGIGIRIEDDVLITKDGYINLSEDIPKEADAIEAWMRK